MKKFMIYLAGGLLLSAPACRKKQSNLQINQTETQSQSCNQEITLPDTVNNNNIQRISGAIQPGIQYDKEELGLINNN